MCSLQPTIDPVKDSQDALASTVACIKCKQAQATINIRFAVYCDACFLEQTFHKFRVTVGKSRRRNDREHILLYLDGQRASSLVLLGLVEEVIEEERNRVNSYSVCFFEDPQESYAQKCSKLGIPFYRLERRATTSMANTASQDKQYWTDMKQVADLYKQVSADKLYLPDTCNHLAATVFKWMIKGGGEVVPWELQPVKQWFGMSVVRPLREHHNLEVTEYNRLKRNAGISHEQESTMNHKSINDLTDHFFASLDQDYSATVSTVTKTASKVSSLWSTNPKEYGECQECGCPTKLPGKLCHSCTVNENEYTLLLSKCNT